MPAEDALLFVDANQYLDLYRMVSGKKVVAALKEQKEHLLVTAQVAMEVRRNKVEVAKAHLAELLAGVSKSPGVPDYLTGGPDIRKELDKIRKRLKEEVPTWLQQIAESSDGLSKSLESIFADAVQPTPDEMQRAEVRKELGNPPGKYDNPLGDQVTWEQILTRCAGKRRIWIITKDEDFGTKHGNSLYLNAALRRDVVLACDREDVEIRCFDNLLGGIEDFVKTVHAKAAKLPKGEKAEEIKEEQDALGPVEGLWFSNWFEAAEFLSRWGNPSAHPDSPDSTQGSKQGD